MDPQPPFFIHLLYLLAHAGARSPYLLRGVGLVTLALTGLAAYRLAQRWQPGAGPWSLALLLTHPLILNEAFVVEIDNTVLTSWVAGTLWWVSVVRWPLTRRAILGFGLWWAFGLWMKLTTPLLLPPAVWLAYAARGRWQEGAKASGLISLIGATLFLAVWTGYSHAVGLPWDHLVARPLEVLRRGPTDPGVTVISELAERAVRIGLWLGPLHLLLWALASWQGMRTRSKPPDAELWAVAMWFGWAMLLGYWFVGGVFWGVAKYQCPLVPVMAVVGGVAVSELTGGMRLSSPPAIAAIGGLALWSGLVVGDPLYLVNHTLRHALLFRPEEIPRHLLALALRLGWLLLAAGVVAVCLAAGRGPWRRAIGAALALGAIGQGIGLTSLHATAPYSTTYCYGRPWSTFRAEIRFAEQITAGKPPNRAWQPWETDHYEMDVFTEQLPGCAPLTGHESPEIIIEVLNRMDCLILDPDYHSAYLQRQLADPRVKTVLAREFDAHPLGTATGWLRRR